MNNVHIAGNAHSPSKVVCVGRNYAAHASELNNPIPSEPLIFVKPNSSISETILLPKNDLIHYEAEISFVIKSNEIHAIAFGLDMTKRSVQNELKAKGLPWERAKAFEASAVFSPFTLFEQSTELLQIELFINGVCCQSGKASDMLFTPQFLIENVAEFMPWEDGDILMSGTPEGVGQLNKGDRLVGKILHGDNILIEHEWKIL